MSVGAHPASEDALNARIAAKAEELKRVNAHVQKRRGHLSHKPLALAPIGPTQQLVLDELRAGPLSVNEVRRRHAIDANRTVVTLAGLAARGLIVADGGVWRAAP